MKKLLRITVLVLLILVVLLTLLMSHEMRGILLIVALFSLAIWQRENLIKPEYNNKILVGLFLLCICLFFNAIYQGGGEPIGLKALKEIAKPDEKEIQKNPYYESMRGFISPQDFISPAEPKSAVNNLMAKITSSFKTKSGTGTWFWWWFWLYSLIIFFLYIPFAFWDEVVAAWHRAEERHEQRPEIIDLRPPALETGQTTPSPRPFPTPRSQNWLQRFQERFAAAFSADLLWDLSENIFRRVVGGRAHGHR